VDDAELARRKEVWKKPDLPRTDRGYAGLYVRHVQQADKGADLDFLVGGSGSETARDSH
jgi:L-arabonate dehydrase